MGKKISLIGASNHLTNRTCVFGSMAGLAPTATVRPVFTSLPGYKFARAAANGHNWETNVFLSQAEKDAKCGLGRSCEDGRSCIRYINPRGSTSGAYYRGGSKFLS